MAAGKFSVAEGQRARNEPASICSVLEDSGPSASLSPGPSIAFFTKGGTKAPLTLLPPASTHSIENQVSIPVPAILIFIMFTSRQEDPSCIQLYSLLIIRLTSVYYRYISISVTQSLPGHPVQVHIGSFRRSTSDLIVSGGLQLADELACAFDLYQREWNDY